MYSVYGMYIKFFVMYISEQHMTMNIHNLFHLSQVVENLGPLSHLKAQMENY